MHYVLCKHAAARFPCTSGAEFDNGLWLCIDCFIGFFKLAPGDHACTLCPAGKNSIKRAATAISDCKVCPANSSWSAVVQDHISCLCNAGFAGNVTAIMNHTAETNCAQCGVGKYKNSVGRAQCTRCGPGKYSAQYAAISEDTCTLCPDKYYAVANRSSCTACEFDAYCTMGVKVLCEVFREGTHTLLPLRNDSVACVCQQGSFLSSEDLCVICTSNHYCGGQNSRRVSCPVHSYSAGGSVTEDDCVCHKGYFRHTNPQNNNATECWVCKADTYYGTAQALFVAECSVCIDPRQQNNMFWQDPTETCDFCVKRALLSPPFCLCDPGSYLTVEMRCEACLENHVCTGAHASPLQCPPKTKALSTGQGQNMDNCVCVDGYFRADKLEALALAISQNIVQLEDVVSLWCVPCPVGFFCSSSAPGSLPESGVMGMPVETSVQKCPVMASTHAHASVSVSDCVCAAGAYTSTNNNITASINAVVCDECSTNHYCVGSASGLSSLQQAHQRACPLNTVSREGTTSIHGCICLPPRAMLPTPGLSFAYDCVQRRMASYTDTAVSQAMQQYDIFAIRPNSQYTEYASMSSTNCLTVETGFVQDCAHDIRVGTITLSDFAIVLFRNILLDPVYLDMSMHLFSSAEYNSIVYKVESYLWVKTSSPLPLPAGGIVVAQRDETTQFLHTSVLPVALSGNISCTTQESYRCALVLESEMFRHSEAYKTDIYNVSKLRSFVYTSLQVFAVFNIDIVTRPRKISMHTHGSMLRPDESTLQMKTAVQMCLAVSTTTTRCCGQSGSKHYMQFGAPGTPSISVIEYFVEASFCPSHAQLKCISTHIGPLASTKGVQCVADIDVLFTSENAQQGLETFEEYVQQIKMFDSAMQIHQIEPCMKMLYIQHRGSTTEYANAIQKQKILGQLHAVYQQHFATEVIFDSGVHSLVTYNVTMSQHSAQNPESSAQNSTQTLLLLQAVQKERMAHVLHALGVNIALESISTPNIMSLRKTFQVDSKGSQEAASLIFVITGVFLSRTNVMALVNNTIWLSTARFANASSVELSALSSSISGTLFFDALSVSDAHALCAHVDAHADLFQLHKTMHYRTIVTQSFVVADVLMSEIIPVQISMQPHIAESRYVLRVSMSIPVETSMMNELLIEVLKKVIFKNAVQSSVRLASLSQQAPTRVPIRQNGSTPQEMPTVEYTHVIYEMPIVHIQQCMLTQNTNTPDYYAELTTVISGLFAIDVAIQLRAVCLVTNILHSSSHTTPATEQQQQTPDDTVGGFCPRQLCNSNSSRGQTAFMAAFPDTTFANITLRISYSETCELQTELVVAAHVDQLTNAAMDTQHMMLLKKTIAFGSTEELTVGTQATFRLLNDEMDASMFVEVFDRLNAPVRMQESSSDGSVSIFSLYNDGMSAAEKDDCHDRPTANACVQNLSVSHNSGNKHHHNTRAGCIEIEASNSRINIAMLKRFIMGKTTPDMLLATSIGIYSQLDAHIQRIPCNGGVQSIVTALMSPLEAEHTRFDIMPKHTIQLTLAIEHTAPFGSTSSYMDNVLRFVPAIAKLAVEAEQYQVSTTAEMHLHTTGITHTMAMAFFEIMMREYFAVHLPKDSIVAMRITEIYPIVQYKSSFPDSLFDDVESLEQLYIKVHISNMRECAEIQPIVTEAVIRNTIYGVPINVKLIDTDGVHVTCNNSVYLEYTSTECNDDTMLPLRQLSGKQVSGGTVLSSDVTCLAAQGHECAARLSSSDVGIFYAILRIVTTQLNPLVYYFRHIVHFCGLDTRLLAPLVTTQALGFFGA